MTDIHELIKGHISTEAGLIEAKWRTLLERQQTLAIVLEQLNQIKAVSAAAVQKEIDELRTKMNALGDEEKELLLFNQTGAFPPHAYARVLLGILSKSLNPEELYALVEALVDTLAVPSATSEEKNKQSVSPTMTTTRSPVTETVTSSTPALSMTSQEQQSVSSRIVNEPANEKVTTVTTAEMYDWSAITAAVGQSRSTLRQRYKVMFNQLKINTPNTYGGFVRELPNLVKKLKFSHMDGMFPRDPNYKIYQETILGLLVVYDLDAQGGYLHQYVPSFAGKALRLIYSVATSTIKNLYVLKIRDEQPLIPQLHAILIDQENKAKSKVQVKSQQFDTAAVTHEELTDHYPDSTSFESVSVRADVIRWIQQHGLRAELHDDPAINRDIQSELNKIISFFRGERTESIASAIKMYSPERTGELILQIRKGKIRVEFDVITTEDGIALSVGKPYSRSRQTTRFKN